MSGEHQSETSKVTRGKWWWILLVVTILAVAFSFAAISHPSVAHAGTNGQQIQFYSYSGKSWNWLQVDGTNQNNNHVVWSRSFNPPVTQYSFYNWWWKGSTSISWRMADNRTGHCYINIPVSQPGDWVQVGVDRQPGDSCWFS